MEPLRQSDIEKVSKELVYDVLAEIDRKYGKDGKNPKPYHNSEHTNEVIESSMAIANLAIIRGKISRHQKSLLYIAAAYHDLEQELGSGSNEIYSATAAKVDMHDRGVFSDNDTAEVVRAILGTTINNDEGLMNQSACSDYISQALADADLAIIGGDQLTFQRRSIDLFFELNPSTQSFLGEAYKGFLEHQINFLEHHAFYTPEAAEIYDNKAQCLAITQEMLAMASKN